jgi:phosphoesterase RecJ-like protein
MDLLSQAIKESQRIVVISHVHPDGDAIGSLLGLQLGLEQLGKEVEPALFSPVPDIFSFLPSGDKAIRQNIPENADLCIVLDMNDINRTGFEKEVRAYAEKGKVITIDHHPKGDLTRLSKAIFHDGSASSTAELIYRLCSTLGIRITRQIGTCLLTGIYTDTGGFQHPNTTSVTLDAASELMRRGAKLNLISQRISHTKTVAGLKLLGIALERLKIVRDGHCAISVLTQADLMKCGASSDDLEGIIGELNALPAVKMTMLLAETEPGFIRGSLRTGEGHSFSVGRLAKALGGGGHPKASGFSVSGKIHFDEAENSWQILPLP